MKKLILFISYFLILTVFCKAQVNLVSNPSFEQLDSCPTSTGQISLAIGWDTLINGGGSSPDLFNECNLSFPCCNVPSNYFVGYQYPKSGEGYSGIITLYYNTTNDHREYIQRKLSNKLISGNNYCAKMYVALSYRSQYSCIPLGMYFDDGQIQSNSYQIPFPNIIPQVVNTGLQLDDTLNWTIIEGNFIATGIEDYITIGNFFDRDSSGVILSYPLLSGESPLERTKVAYYYIDDVSVIDISTPAYSGVDTTITIGDSVFIGRTPEIGLNDDCVWYLNGNPVDTVAGLWVMPDSTTTYILEQTICGYTTYDTVTVTVLPTSVNELFKENSLRIFPNPSNGELWIKQENGLFDQCKVVIFDITGKVVFEKNMLINNETKITPNLKQGTYFIQIIPNNSSINPFKEKISIIE